MDEYRDQTYLLNDQYKDATNFLARLDLHRRFRVNPYGFHHWVFDHLKLDDGWQLLELGCGPGLLWLSNRRRIPAHWQIVLTDFSPGMLQDARQRLGEERFSYAVADAQALPLADASFDVVVANHMLYHIPDLPRALTEIRRVLKPTGRFYASTIGREHMHELDELIEKHWPNLAWKGWGKSSPFILENGKEVLAPFFGHVTLHSYKDALDVTEAEPLVAYMLSGRIGSLLASKQRAALTAVIQQELTERGTIHLTNVSGLFEAQNA